MRRCHFPVFELVSKYSSTAHTTRLTVLTPGVDHIPYERKCLLSSIVSPKMTTPPRILSTLLGRMKKYLVPRSSPVPDLDALDDLFLGTTQPVPDLEGSLSKVMIGAFTVESVDGHKRGVGAASLTNFQYHLKLQGYSTQMGMWRHVNAIPQYREMISSYRAAVLPTDHSPFKPPTRTSHSVPADGS